MEDRLNEAIRQKLEERHLPGLFTTQSGDAVTDRESWEMRRVELVRLLEQEVYGRMPEGPVRVEEISCIRQEMDFGGKCLHQFVTLGITTQMGIYLLPFHLLIPVAVKQPPVIVNLAFTPNVPDAYTPAEELIDSGFALAKLCYEEAARDDSIMAGGLVDMFPEHMGKPDSWGKIAMWSWAASRVIDYVTSRPDLDTARLALAGHSRLGKAALWCAALDTRVFMVYANESGCTGAALSRRKRGEQIKDITRRFPTWLCGNYEKYAGREEALPFDQHWLLALIAPRYLYISGAEQDIWADPESEFLSAAAASPVYALYGVSGLVTPDRLPCPGSELHEGRVGYHIRQGTHHHTRQDWQIFLRYFERQAGKGK